MDKKDKNKGIKKNQLEETIASQRVHFGQEEKPRRKKERKFHRKRFLARILTLYSFLERALQDLQFKR